MCFFFSLYLFYRFFACSANERGNSFCPFLFMLMPFSLLLYHLFVGSNWMHQLALFFPGSPSSIIQYFCSALFVMLITVCIVDTCIVPLNSPCWMQRINFIRALFLRMAPQMSNTIFHQLNGKGSEWTIQKAVWVVNDMVNIYVCNMCAHGRMHCINT